MSIGRKRGLTWGRTFGQGKYDGLRTFLGRGRPLRTRPRDHGFRPSRRRGDLLATQTIRIDHRMSAPRAPRAPRHLPAGCATARWAMAPVQPVATFPSAGPLVPPNEPAARVTFRARRIGMPKIPYRAGLVPAFSRHRRTRPVTDATRTKFPAAVGHFTHDSNPLPVGSAPAAPTSPNLPADTGAVDAARSQSRARMRYIEWWLSVVRNTLGI